MTDRSQHNRTFRRWSGPALPAMLALFCWARPGPAVAAETNAPAEPPDAVLQCQDAAYILACADEAALEAEHATAIELYDEAARIYAAIRTEYPEWNNDILLEQQAYCTAQAEQIAQALPEPGLSPAATNEVAAEAPLPLPELPPAPSAEWVAWEPTAPPAMAALPTTDTNSLGATVRQLLEQDRITEARSLLLDAMQATPDDYNTRLLLGVVQCQAGKFDDALFILNQLVEEVPTNALGHVCLSAGYFGTGRLLDASDALKNALALDPSLSEAHYNLAQILLRMDPPDVESATRHYLKMLDLGGQPDPALAERLGLSSAAH